MAQPYVGEIRLFAGTFPPAGWMFCDGALLPISEYETLFQLIGTTYGGDGQETFALPNLSGRVPIHFGTGGGQSYVIGEEGGVEDVTLTVAQMPTHNHSFNASTSVAMSPNPGSHVLAQAVSTTPYVQSGATVALNSAAIAGNGGSQPHTNLQPYLCMNYIISLFGLFPSQT